MDSPRFAVEPVRAADVTPGDVLVANDLTRSCLVIDKAQEGERVRLHVMDGIAWQFNQGQCGDHLLTYDAIAVVGRIRRDTQ